MTRHRALAGNRRAIMEYITLPGTELKVSRICLGTMQFSNSWEWPCTQAQATAVVDAAMASGVNFFDTAQAYQVDGDRCSEKMLGIALGERRSEVVIASKFGLHAGEDQTVCDAAAVTQAIDDTLAALGTDYLDLMQIHWPGNIGYLGEQQADWLDAKEIVAALEAAVGAGKLKYYGLCNFGTGAKNASYLVRCHLILKLAILPRQARDKHRKSTQKERLRFFAEDLAAFESAGGKPVSNQLPYNLLFRTIESGILPACIDKSMGVLTYSSLQQALLTGKFTDPSTVPEGRRRTRLFAADSTPKSRHGGPGVESELFAGKKPVTFWSAFHIQMTIALPRQAHWREAFKTFKGKCAFFAAIAELQKIADSTDGAFSMVDLAMGWLLAQPGVSCLLVGASTVSYRLQTLDACLPACCHGCCLLPRLLPAACLRLATAAAATVRRPLLTRAPCLSSVGRGRGGGKRVLSRWLTAPSHAHAPAACMMQPEQAMRNAQIKPVPVELLEECTKVTEALRVAYLAAGGQVDPYGATCRIHGNSLP